MPKTAATPDLDVIASAIEIGAVDGVVARRVKLLPYGTFHGRDGRGPYILQDKAHAEQVIAATRDFMGSADMLFNYDHQTEYAAVPNVGGQAKAAGWVKPGTIVADDDGIYGEVEWTPGAAAALQAKEYRYHSPHFRVNKDSRRVTLLVNAGLTNSPNIDLPALASQQPGAAASEEGTPMTQIALAPLVAALALSATAGEAEVLAAIGGLKDKASTGDDILASARTTLGLAQDVDSVTVLAAVSQAKDAGKPDPEKWVPKVGFDELKARVDKLDEDRVLAMVDQAIETGKIAPSLRDWALDLGRKNETSLHSYLGGAPVFEGGTPVAPAGAPKPEKGKLNDEERAICAMTGVSHEDFLARRDVEEAA